MKRFLAAMLLALGLAGHAGATGIAYDQDLANEVVTTTKSYVITMGGAGTGGGTIDLLSASLVMSSATPTSSTFNDGRTSTATITVISTSGILGAYLNVAGTKLTFGTDISTAGTTAALATNISAAINANSALQTILTSTAPAGSSVVYSTTTHVGVNTNYYLFSSSPAKVSAGPNFKNGADSATSLSSPIISLPSHGLTTGMAALYSTGSGVALNPLVNQTTYYVIALDANRVELAATSTGSYAGAYITITSSSTTGPHSFTLSPLPLTGTLVLTWQASNDGVNWAGINVATASFSTPYTTSTSLWDFGTIDYKYIRAQVAGPSQGGALTVIHGYGKRYGLGL